MQFYVKNVHRLIDIPPRRLSLIAKMIADNPDPAERKERLEGMLRPTDQRPRLMLPRDLGSGPTLAAHTHHGDLTCHRMNRTSSRRSQRNQSHQSVNQCRRQRIEILEPDPPAPSPPEPNETMAPDAILDAELGSDAEPGKARSSQRYGPRRKWAFCRMISPPCCRSSAIPSRPIPTGRGACSSFVTARGILCQASEMMRARGGDPENTADALDHSVETPPPERTPPPKLRDVVLTAEDRDRILRSFDLAKFRRKDKRRHA